MSAKTDYPLVESGAPQWEAMVLEIDALRQVNSAFASQAAHARFPVQLGKGDSYHDVSTGGLWEVASVEAGVVWVPVDDYSHSWVRQPDIGAVRIGSGACRPTSVPNFMGGRFCGGGAVSVSPEEPRPTLRDELMEAIPQLHAMRGGALNLGTVNRELIADAVLALPVVSRALRIAAIVDSEPMRNYVPGVNGYDDGERVGSNVAFARLRAVGVVDPKPEETK